MSSTSDEGMTMIGIDLEVRGVTKRYGNLTALDDVSFTVRAGELFGFIGSNGAGKTTTMRIVLGVLAADAGEVLLGGRAVDLDVRRKIGYMPAERGLYPKMKVGAQLQYLARLHGLGAAAAHSAVTRWTDRLGVSDRLEATVDSLSTGNQQRVQLAAALIHDPDVLVLDEPFSGLDPVAVDVMSAVLRERAAAGAPVIFSSHQLELVEALCDSVGIISGGVMRALGTVESLRADGSTQVVVDAPNAPDGWADAVPGATVHSRRGASTVVVLDDDADDQALLRAALATGPVHSFERRRPPLVELFRDVVSNTTTEEDGKP